MIRMKGLAPGVQCNMVILSAAAINDHYDVIHRCDRFSRTPIDQHYAKIEQDREAALAIFRSEGYLRVFSDNMDWYLIKGRDYFDVPHPDPMMRGHI